jgi:hypothetical protein
MRGSRTSTMTFPRKIVTTAWRQSIPSLISDDASMYVGMHADMLIHSTARSLVPHRRPDGGTGAMSAL